MSALFQSGRSKMKEQELRDFVAGLIEQHTNGNQREFARLYGLHQGDLSSFLLGKRGPGTRLLEVVGVEPVTEYRFVLPSNRLTK
jgi:hypothetical protein